MKAAIWELIKTISPFFSTAYESAILTLPSLIDFISDPLSTIPASINSSKKESDEGKLEAIRLDKILQPIHNSMFVESNPSPVKYAAKLLGLCEEDVRLPLVKVTEPTKEAVKKALVSANLL